MFGSRHKLEVVVCELYQSKAALDAAVRALTALSGLERLKAYRIIGAMIGADRGDSPRRSDDYRFGGAAGSPESL